MIDYKLGGNRRGALRTEGLGAWVLEFEDQDSGISPDTWRRRDGFPRERPAPMILRQCKKKVGFGFPVSTTTTRVGTEPLNEGV